MAVLDQKETPGLGDNITKEPFQSRFKGLPSGGLIVTKMEPATGNQVLAVTGATVSSKSVVDIVNSAIDNCKEPLGRLAAGGSGE